MLALLYNRRELRLTAFSTIIEKGMRDSGI